MVKDWGPLPQKSGTRKNIHFSPLPSGVALDIPARAKLGKKKMPKAPDCTKQRKLPLPQKSQSAIQC